MEYKQSAANLRKIAQTVVAFTNGSGGELIIGVEDGSRRIVGLSENEVDELLERLPLSVADQVRPQLYPEIYTRMIDNRQVVVVQVFPGMHKPYFIASEGLDRGTFIRVGAHTRRAEGDVLEELKLFRQRLTYDEAPIVSCAVEELDLQILPAALRSEKALLSLDVLSRDPHSGQIYPTRGGILVLHPNPQRYLPESEVLVSRMRGLTGRDTVESTVIQGCIPSQAAQTLEILAAWLGSSPRLTGNKYENTSFNPPLTAVRETLHNALFHRQYSIHGATKVALYPDRLEIFSPGHFSGPFIQEALGDGTSYIRNKVVCQLARHLNLIEKRGTGIAAVFSAMASAQLPPPAYEEGPNWFKVTLSREVQQQLNSEPLGLILKLLESHPTISRQQVEEAIQVSRGTAVSYLESLIQQGRLKRIGRGPKTRYTVTGI